MINSWEDLRCFLAVADSGSLSSAARQLRLSQPTMGRRIKALEKYLDARLFSQTSNGYSLTSLGMHVYEQAQQMEQAVLSIERRVRGEEEALVGRVSISTTECIAVSWLVGQIPEFNRRYPGIEIEVDTSIKLLNLFRRETDIALRVGNPGSEKLVGRRLGEVTFGLYGSEHYLAEHGVPARLSELPNHIIVESVGEIANLAQVRLLRQVSSGATMPIRCNHLLTQLALARTGLGLIVIPKYVTGFIPELRRILPDQFDLKLDLWILTHRDLKDAARFRTVREFIAEAVQRDHAIFTE